MVGLFRALTVIGLMASLGACSGSDDTNSNGHEWPGAGGVAGESSGGTSSGGTSSGGALGGGGEASSGGTIGGGGEASSGGALESGGATSNGGTDGGSGFEPSTGGTIGSGGDTSSGGEIGNSGGAAGGGASGSGGGPSTGGIASTGGLVGSGGAAATGGMPSTGGALGTGGVPSSGGALGSGGTSPVAPTCADGVRNGSERGVDCGGSCAVKCPNGTVCQAPADCASGQCVGNRCTTSGCTMGLPGLPVASTGNTPLAVALTDLNGDGALDAVATPGPFIFMNDGRGNLGAPKKEAAEGWYVAAGDLDGNGKQDLVVAVAFAIRILLNQGGGVFTTATITQTDHNPSTPTLLADLDGDGKLDISYGTQSPAGNFVSTLYNQGSGAFGGRVDLTASPHDMRVVHVVDVNGDGKPDLVAGASSNNVITSSLSVFMNQGGRAFSSIVSYPVPTNPRSITAGDFNQDGKLDLAIAGEGPLVTLPNAGGGTFGAPVPYHWIPNPPSPTYGNIRAMVGTSDVDGDGKVDLVVTGPAAVNVLLNIGGGEFLPSAEYTATIPSALALGDMDRDGRPDIVYGGIGGLTTMLNRGGAFVSPQHYSTGATTDAVTGAPASQTRLFDLNGDGKLDIVTIEGTSEVVVRLRVAEGFGSRLTYPTAPSARSVLAADLDGDSRPELVVGTNRGLLSVLKNLGGGSFGPHADRVVGSSPAPIAVGDFDGDGFPDIAAGDCDSGSVSVLANPGALAFDAPVRHDAGPCPRAIATGDLDRNGRVDLVVANLVTYEPNGVSVLLNGGQGSFAAPVAYPSGGQTVDVAVADLDADGRSDVVAACFQDGRLAVLLNQGDGTLRKGPNLTTPSTPVDVAVVDLDGDGKPDLVAADTYRVTTSAGDFGLFRNLGSGTFASAVTLSQAGPANSSADFGDVDGDGKADLVASDLGGPSVRFGNGDFTFDYARYLDLDNQPASITAGDLDGDGKPELIEGGSIPNLGASSSVFHNRGGTFGDRTVLQTEYTPLQMIVADLDGDGVRDIVTAERRTATSGYAAGMVGVYLNRGSAGFEQTGYPPNSSAIAVGDLDGDGRPDIAAVGNVTAQSTGNSEHELHILLNQGNGAFSTAGKYPTADANAVAIGDVDANGALDVLVLNGSDSYYNGVPVPGRRVSILLNDGNGSLTAGTPLLTQDSPQTMTLADLDNSGTLDVLFSSTNMLSVFRGLGNGLFAARADYPQTFNPLHMVVVDLDDDGWKEVAVTNHQLATVHVFRGNAQASLTASVQYPTGDAPSKITAADLNGDGRPDLATTSSVGVSVLMNRCW